MKTIPLPAYQTFFESRYKYFEKFFGRGPAVAVTVSGFAGVMMRLIVSLALRVVRGGAAMEKVRLYWAMAPWFLGAERPWRGRR